MLFHVSAKPSIAEFIPRRSKYTHDPVVWAVHDEKIRNYLVPRDCPRVTYHADSHTVAADSERFLGTSAAVIAIEASWWNRIRSFTQYCYSLPSDTFECIDECAGYFVSRAPVRPLQVFLYEIAVAESHRRRGIGTQMISELKAICWAQDVMKMWVPTGRSNVAATRLYATTGATPLPSGDEVTYAYTRESFRPTSSE